MRDGRIIRWLFVSFELTILIAAGGNILFLRKLNLEIYLSSQDYTAPLSFVDVIYGSCNLLFHIDVKKIPFVCNIILPSGW